MSLRARQPPLKPHPHPGSKPAFGSATAPASKLIASLLGDPQRKQHPSWTFVLLPLHHSDAKSSSLLRRKLRLEEEIPARCCRARRGLRPDSELVSLKAHAPGMHLLWDPQAGHFTDRITVRSEPRCLSATGSLVLVSHGSHVGGLGTHEA